MTSDSTTLLNCPNCDEVMDISMIAPFTLAKCPHCEVESRVKTQMGRFKLIERLGIGGMSYVFVAKDEDLDRDVAVKILNEEHQANPERTEQFLREAKITASISHPNIVRVFTVGEDLGRLFIAMELVNGSSLEEIIRNSGTMDERTALQLTIDVVEGLRAAAAEGLIHRDIKPGNILVDQQGRARIVDFGLALLTEEENKDTDIWATPFYVPPETLEGGDEDFRSDMYSLGASLYHALAGRPPCEDDSLSIDQLKIAKTEVANLGQINPELNPASIELVHIAMAHDPADRFESYDLMLESLKLAVHSLVTGEEVSIHRQVQQDSAAPFAGKAKLLAGVLGGVFMIVGGMLLWGHFSNEDSKPKPQDAAPASPSSAAVSPPEEGAVADAEDQIWALYQESRELIDKGNYSDGAMRLRDLIESQEIPLTTLSWASLEAAACFFQDGKGEQARELMLKLRRDLEQSGTALEGTAATADSLAEQILQIAPVDSKNLAPDPRGIEKLGYFVAALKNWEQGQRESAVLLFKAFTEIPLTDSTEALAVYQQRAKAYLRDAQRLNQAKPNLEVESLDELSVQRAKIDEIYEKLETRGRTKVEIREWSLALAHRQRDLKMRKELADRSSEPPANPFGDDDPESDDWTKIEELTKQWKFDEALQLLKTLDTPNPEQLEVNIYLLEMALNFKYNLISVFVARKPILKNRANQDVGEFKRLHEGRIEVAVRNGVETMNWSELSIDQLNKIMLAVTKAEQNEFQRNLKYERLIVFNYLVGNRERGISAAERLDSASFKKRWSKAMKYSQFKR